MSLKEGSRDSVMNITILNLTFVDFYKTADKETGKLIIKRIYKSPDGTTGTLGFFHKEIKKGDFHGCTIRV